MIIAGHGRVQAAKKLNMDQVPCIVLKGLSEAQKKAYIIADNKLALNAGWDDELLKIEIAGLQDFDFALDLLVLHSKHFSYFDCLILKQCPVVHLLISSFSRVGIGVNPKSLLRLNLTGGSGFIRGIGVSSPSFSSVVKPIKYFLY